MSEGAQRRYAEVETIHSKGPMMNDVRRGAGMGLGLVLGVVLAVIGVPLLLMLLLCGGCATLAGIGSAVPDAKPQRDVQELGSPADDGSNGEVVDPQAQQSDAELEPIEQPAPAVTEDLPDPSLKITMHEFRQLRDGMTYDEVHAIVGVHPEELSRSSIADIETVMVGWSNANGSNANAMFQNGRLVSRAQFGLPSGPSRYSIIVSREREKRASEERERGRQMAAERIAAAEAEKKKLAADNVTASEELKMLLASIAKIETTDDVDKATELIVALQMRYPNTDAAKSAKAEADALAMLRLAFVTRGRMNDPTTLLERTIERYPGTIAAAVAEDLK